MTSILLSQLYSRTTVQAGDIACKPINSKVDNSNYIELSIIIKLERKESLRHGASIENLRMHKHMRVIHRKNGWPNVWLSKGGIARSWQRRGFRENATNFLTFAAHWVHGSVFTTNRHPRGEIDLTHTHTHTHTDTTNTHTHRQTRRLP